MLPKYELCMVRQIEIVKNYIKRNIANDSKKSCCFLRRAFIFGINKVDKILSLGVNCYSQIDLTMKKK